MSATLMAVRDGNVRVDWTPTRIAGVLIRTVAAVTIPETLRDHAHRAVPERSRNQWFTVGQYCPAGARKRVWLVAKRLPTGAVVFGVEA